MPPFTGVTRPRVFDEDFIHPSAGDPEEMRSIPEAMLTRARQSGIRLMNEIGRLQGVFRSLAAKPAAGQREQIGIDAAKELFVGLAAPLVNSVEEEGNISRLTRRGRASRFFLHMSSLYTLDENLINPG